MCIPNVSRPCDLVNESSIARHTCSSDYRSRLLLSMVPRVPAALASRRYSRNFLLHHPHLAILLATSTCLPILADLASTRPPVTLPPQPLLLYFTTRSPKITRFDRESFVILLDIVRRDINGAVIMNEMSSRAHCRALSVAHASLAMRFTAHEM